MGIHSRDYARDPNGGGWAPRGDITVVPWIIGLCAVVLVLDKATQGVVNEWLQLKGTYLWPRLQIWRLITFGFAHGGAWHFIFNMFALWLFGRYVEPIYGPREFLAFYLTAIVLSGFGFLALDAGFGRDAIVYQGVEYAFSPSAVGASGGVMAVTILAACHFPRERIYIYGLIPVELWLLALITVFIDLVGVLQGGAGIAHGAHLAGAAFGFLYFRYHWRILGKLGRFSLPDFRKMFRRSTTRRAPVRIYSPPAEPDEIPTATIDRLLQKIHEGGEASLTEEERATLATASRQAARRRQRPE